MKRLNRLILINWHNYELQMMDFGDLTFLTGKNATGKSTIIDALQLVILGDSSGTFFNKAASAKSSRSLQGYLFGEMGDDGQAGFRYRRKGPFSSYVVTGWTDTETKKDFMAGFMADCYADGSFKRHWFIALENFDTNTFLDSNDIPLNFNALKAKYSSSRSFEAFDINNAYQNALRARLGNINPKYMTLLRKAVPFTPITDIEKFITESICDIDAALHIEDMQNEIRTYTSLEAESEVAAKRLETLEEIEEQYKNWEEVKERYQLYSYVLLRSSLHRAEHEIASLHKALEEKQKENFALEKERASVEAELSTLKGEIEEKRKELYTSDEKKKEEKLRDQIHVLEEQKATISRRFESAISSLVRIGEDLAKTLSSLRLKEDDLSTLSQRMKALDGNRIFSFDFDEAIGMLSSFKERLDGEKAALRLDIEGLEERHRGLRDRLANLEKGIRPYPTATVALMERLKEEGIASKVLAQELEIADDSWRDSLEALLGSHRFDLLVEHKDYAKAKEILLSLSDGDEIAVVDESAYTSIDLPEDSICHQLTSDNRSALSYVASLIGDVGTKEEGRWADRRAHFQETSSARRLSIECFTSPFLGRKSIELQIERVKSELETVERELEAKKERLGVYNILPLRTIAEESRKRYEEDIAEGRKLSAIEAQLEELNEELEGLDMLYLENMAALIARLEEDERRLASKRDNIITNQGRVQSEIDHLNNSAIPEKEGVKRSIEEQIDSSFSSEWIEKTAEPHYQNLLKEGREGLALAESYERTQKSTATRMANEFDRLKTLRITYNREYHAPYDPDRESNEDYRKEYEELASVRLPEYRAKIQEAKEAAYRQFREDFISKIKSRIEEVKQQIDDLNRSLRQSTFGRDRYRFEVGAHPDYRQYYEMFMDPLLLEIDGGNLFNDSFFSKYQLEINDLFDKLIINDLEKASAERVAEYERNIARYTDYRTYLIFDLIVIDKDTGAEQRLSRTLLKKSGGETQLPFYIALLASFSQVCRIRQRQNNTVRLVIFDEAFSKMDAERIRESIKLLRRFELQALFSAPSDKIGDIAPLVDDILITYRDSSYSFVRSYSPGDLANG